jgi:two-component system invasion response regulator UvrY
MINILIAGDHTLFRDGIKKLLALEPDFKIMGEAGHSHEILELAKKRQLDLVLLDITLPGRSGLDIIRDIRKVNKKVYILVLTMHPERSICFSCI